MSLQKKIYSDYKIAENRFEMSPLAAQSKTKKLTAKTFNTDLSTFTQYVRKIFRKTDISYLLIRLVRARIRE